MKVKDIILTASSYLGVEEKVRDFIEHRVPFCKEGELLLRCYNLIEKEVAQDYIPLIIEETFQTETGAVYYSQFSEQAVRVIKTQDSYGNDIACTLFPEYLKTQAGTIVIRYAYKPTDKTIARLIYAFLKACLCTVFLPNIVLLTVCLKNRRCGIKNIRTP